MTSGCRGGGRGGGVVKNKMFLNGGGGGEGGGGAWLLVDVRFSFFCNYVLSFSNLRHLFLKYYNKIKHSKYS